MKQRLRTMLFSVSPASVVLQIIVVRSLALGWVANMMFWNLIALQCMFLMKELCCGAES